MKIREMNVPKYQAEAIKLYLTESGGPIVDDNDEVTLRILPWANGREQCYAGVFYADPKKECLVVVFGECRGSDGIFVDYWREKQLPSVEDVTWENEGYEEAYRSRADFGYGDIGSTVEFIWNLVETWLDTSGQRPKSIREESSDSKLGD